MTSRAPIVGVCVATFRRPPGLAALLAALANQRFPAEALPRVLVFVTDNDPEGSARSTIDRARRDHDLEIHDRVETRRGVVHARNASVAAALETGVDFVVFVDDDESPHADWLATLLATQRASGAPIVAGPVVEVLDDALPAWYRDAGFYRPPERADGAPAPYAACGNSLFAAALLEAVSGPFDPRFNVSGGEDVFLSLTLMAAGAAIVWSPQALVDTHVPADRARLRHVARRHHIGAANYTRAEGLVAGWRPTRVVTGAGRVARGLVLVATGAVRLAPPRMALGVVVAAEGLGVISGALGGGAGRAWWSADDR
ncbi:MAG: glycosyltransferase [Acidimicrobiales bacterium]